MARIFVYDDREFPDPDSEMSVDQVKSTLSDFYDRRGQRHQLGAGPGRERRRAGDPARTALHRRDLPPGARAHAPAARPADGRVDQAAGRGLRGRPRPHRPGPHHQPDDGVAGATGGPPHGGGHLPLHGPLPGHGAGNGHPNLRHPGDGGAGGAVWLRAGDSVPVTNGRQTHSRKETRRRRNHV